MTAGMPDNPSVPPVTPDHDSAAVYIISPSASVIIRNATPRARTSTTLVTAATNEATTIHKTSCTKPTDERERANKTDVYATTTKNPASATEGRTVTPVRKANIMSTS